MNNITRLRLKKSLGGAAGAMIFPTIVPSSVFGKNSPSNKINIGQIGCGRIARGHDMPETLKLDLARIIAVCDLDKNKVNTAKNSWNIFTKKKPEGQF